MKGHIKITDKVYFMYHELPKPDKRREIFDILVNAGIMRKYKASKKTVEVSNVKKSLGEWVLTEIEVSAKDLTTLQIKNNQPCEAEVTDTAIIIKLT